MTNSSVPACEANPDCQKVQLSLSIKPRLLTVLTVFSLLIASVTVAFGQENGLGKLTIKSNVLNEDRAIIVRTPAVTKRTSEATRSCT